MFAANLTHFVAQPLLQNRTTFGVPLGINSISSVSNILPQFWNRGQNRAIPPAIPVCSGVNGALGFMVFAHFAMSLLILPHSFAVKINGSSILMHHTKDSGIENDHAEAM